MIGTFASHPLSVYLVTRTNRCAGLVILEMFLAHVFSHRGGILISCGDMGSRLLFLFFFFVFVFVFPGSSAGVCVCVFGRHIFCAVTSFCSLVSFSFFLESLRVSLLPTYLLSVTLSVMEHRPEYHHQIDSFYLTSCYVRQSLRLLVRLRTSGAFFRVRVFFRTRDERQFARIT